MLVVLYNSNHIIAIYKHFILHFTLVYTLKVLLLALVDAKAHATQVSFYSGFNILNFIYIGGFCNDKCKRRKQARK